jgi:hypothetical protein
MDSVVASGDAHPRSAAGMELPLEPSLPFAGAAERSSPESLEELITNVETLVQRLGEAVDPDLARLCAAVYADVEQVRARPRRAPISGTGWAGMAVVALLAIAISVGVVWYTRA